MSEQLCLPACAPAQLLKENMPQVTVGPERMRETWCRSIVTFFLEKKYLTATQNAKNGVDVLPKIIQVCHSSLFVFQFWCHNLY